MSKTRTGESACIVGDSSLSIVFVTHSNTSSIRASGVWGIEPLHGRLSYINCYAWQNTNLCQIYTVELYGWRGGLGKHFNKTD